MPQALTATTLMANLIGPLLTMLLVMFHKGLSQNASVEEIQDHDKMASFVEIQNHAQFESVLTKQQLNETNATFWSWRSEASGNKTLRLEDVSGTYVIEFNICVAPLTIDTNVTLQLENIRYSNDGPTDIIQVSMNNEMFGLYNTDEKWGSGHEWNIFHNSGQIGEPLHLKEGKHLLHVTARTDQYGVELDRISMNAMNHSPDTHLFCGGRLIIK